ncbi:MAG: TolC family outer membrane protein [Campylobacterota bacterium]|nr:TolC family outer membrane protein [Campylobacterota bacterium]
MIKHLLFLSLVLTLNAQDIKTTMRDVISTNPIILERLKNYNSTKEEIRSAKAGFYPKVDLSIGIGYENTKKTDRPEQADTSFDLNVYKNSLTYTQNFFNGYKTTYQIKQKEFQSISASYSYVEKVNNTAFEMVDSYLQLMKNIELYENEKNNVKINQGILDKVRKLYDSGLTTLSEVNKIEASLALANSNAVAQDNTLLDSKYNMHKILGRHIDTNKMQKPILNLQLPNSIEKASQLAMINNPSLLVASFNIKLAQASYKEKKSAFYPSIDVDISQSINKNLSGTEGKERDFKAMLYLKYNIFNGYADTSNLQKSISEIHKEIQTKNSLRRKVIEGLNLSFASYSKLNKQLKYLKQYKRFSFKTLSLYTKEYDLGRRSLLDLLSAQNDFIKSKSQIINTEYNILFAKYRILDAMGILVNTVLENDNSDINLNNLSNDKLPISYDADNDLIPDEKDICNNSLELTTKNIYGCKKNIPEIKSIEKYKSFLFWKKSYRATSWTVKKLNNMIKTIQPYGFRYIKFDIISNVHYKDMSKEKLLSLCEKRAETIKELLIKAGAFHDNIKLTIYTNEAPIVSDESENSKLLNNRVDIIVKKLKK